MSQKPLDCIEVGTGTDCHAGKSMPQVVNAEIIDTGNFARFFERLPQVIDVGLDRFYPSSKTCSGCGNIKSDLKLSHRSYVCENCGLVIDRDLNAAINLKNKSASYAESACGVPKQLDTLVSGGAMNQEVNSNVQHCLSFI